MIIYEFMRAHGKGSEGSEKRGRGAKKERGCEKKGGARCTGTPPVYAPAGSTTKARQIDKNGYIDIDGYRHIDR